MIKVHENNSLHFKDVLVEERIFLVVFFIETTMMIKNRYGKKAVDFSIVLIKIRSFTINYLLTICLLSIYVQIN